MMIRRIMLMHVLAFVSLVFIYTFDAVGEKRLQRTKEDSIIVASAGHRAISEITIIEKPVIHLFVDYESNKHDKLLHKFILSRWKKFGFEPVVLSMEDLKKHEDFNKWNNKLNSLEICCLAKHSFLQHLAMSTVKGGGFFATNYLFPLNRMSQIVEEFNKKKKLPNDGKFTSFDGTLGSFLSASQREWIRVNKAIFNNLEQNNAVTLENIKHVFQDYTVTRISNLSILFAGKQFEYDICDHTKNHYAIRFHYSDLLQYGKDRVKEVRELAEAWLKLYDLRCDNNRTTPIMFTFRQSIEGSGEEHDDLIDVWSNYWKGSGFKTHVLSLGDAKRNPLYENVMEIIQKDSQAKKPTYEGFCFLRWVAMASSGGGFFSDYDTVPEGFTAIELPNEGRFSANVNGIQNLISGTASHWNTMVTDIYDNYYDNTVNIKTWWFDMLAMGKLNTDTDCLFLFYLRELDIKTA